MNDELPEDNDRDREMMWLAMAEAIIGSGSYALRGDARGQIQVLVDWLREGVDQGYDWHGAYHRIYARWAASRPLLPSPSDIEPLVMQQRPSLSIESDQSGGGSGDARATPPTGYHGHDEGFYWTCPVCVEERAKRQQAAREWEVRAEKIERAGRVWGWALFAWLMGGLPLAVVAWGPISRLHQRLEDWLQYGLRYDYDLPVLLVNAAIGLASLVEASLVAGVWLLGAWLLLRMAKREKLRRAQ